MNTFITFIVNGIFVMLPLLFITKFSIASYKRNIMIFFYSIVAAAGIIWAMVDVALFYEQLVPESYAFNMLLHTYWINMEIGFTYMAKVMQLIALPGLIVLLIYIFIKKKIAH